MSDQTITDNSKVNAGLIAENERLKSELAARDKEIVALREALYHAMVNMEDWASYASEYFHEKHDLKGDLESCAIALESPATQAAVNRVRSDAIMEAIQQDFDTVCDSVSREYIAGMADGIEQYEKHLEEYANKLRNPDQANCEE